MLTLHCTSYGDKQTVPNKYVHRSVTGGQNVSPGFRWEDPPITTKSFALSIIDPHPIANDWVHWFLINIPFRERELAEGASRSDRLPPGSKELLNSFGEKGYGGPAPPRSSGAHPYVATLYAVTAESIDLPPNATLRQFRRAIEGSVAAEASMTGYFERK